MQFSDMPVLIASPPLSAEKIVPLWGIGLKKMSWSDIMYVYTPILDLCRISRDQYLYLARIASIGVKRLLYNWYTANYTSKQGRRRPGANKNCRSFMPPAVVPSSSNYSVAIVAHRCEGV